MIIKVDIAIARRLDKYLKHLYPEITQGFIEQALRKKYIIVNSKKAKASTRVIKNDEILIHEKLGLHQEKEKKEIFSVIAMKLASKILGDYLIFENEDFLAINKPAGLATQGGSKINLSVDDALKYLNSQNYDLRLVHRLDKETSGLLLIAKSYQASVMLGEAFKKKLLTKTYIAIVYGKPSSNFGEVANFITKMKIGNQEVVGIDNEYGRMAITNYRFIKALNNNLSLIEFTPITGRMHQLRFHAKFLNCPIVGDSKYNDNKHSLSISKRMLLHASCIILCKEIFGKEIRLIADLPSYFRTFL